MLNMSCQSAIPASALPQTSFLNPAAPKGPFPSRITAEGTRGWEGLTARACVIQCRGYHATERQYSHPVVVAILETIGGVVQVHCGEEDRDTRPARSAHVSLLPAGATVRLDAQGVSLFREVVIEIMPQPGTSANAWLSRATADPKTMIVNRDVLHVAELISADCLSAHPDDRQYGEGLSIVFLKALSRLAEPAAEMHAQGGLAPWQLRRITEFLESKLADGARIDTLARLVNLSSSYLIRAFKVSTGVTPQQWLRAARIRRVQELLVDGDLALAEIAQATGFADQAHLSRIFRQASGESPGVWRRRVRMGPVQ